MLATRSLITFTGLAALLILGLACSDDTDKSAPDGAGAVKDGGAGGADTLTVAGTVEADAGKTVPASAKVMAIWQVSASSTDYSWKLGEATTSGKDFTMKFTAAPPAGALNNGQVGVALLMMVGSGVVVADGKLSGSSGPGKVKLLGSAPTHAIVYHVKNVTSGYKWSSKFKAGYSCARVAGKSGSFDLLEPVDCSKVKVIVSDAPKFPNWT